MIKIIIIILLAGTLLGNVYGQVGVNTEDPTSALDINGSLRTMDNLLVGGSDAVIGSAGTAGQFLISKGAGIPPQWQTVTAATPVTGDWYLIGSISRTDTQGGLLFDQSETSSPVSYASTYSIYKSVSATGNAWSITGNGSTTAIWREFEDFALELPAFKYDLRVVINVQFLVQSYWPLDTYLRDIWMSYAVGVFKDISTGTTQKTAQIMASRQGGVFGDSKENNNPQQLLTFVATIDLPASTTATKLYILGTQRNNSGAYDGGELTLGHLLSNSLVDDSILRRASMRADIYKRN